MTAAWVFLEGDSTSSRMPSLRYRHPEVIFKGFQMDVTGPHLNGMTDEQID